MAARSDGSTSKVQRKLTKKIARIQDQLSKTENITVSEHATKVICVQNGGLMNGVSQADLRAVFAKYGHIQDVIMVPQKAYCFVCFDSPESAATAKEELTGFVLREGKDPSQNVTLYIFFVSHAPASVCPSKELPPGLKLVCDFISEEEEEKLLQAVSFEEEASCGLGSTLKHRQVKHFGYEFKYGINNVDPNSPLEEGIPEECRGLLQKALDLNLVGHMPDQLTVNRYLPGQGIPPHVDTPSAFEDGIMSLSCGSQVVMDFRHPDGQHLSVLLPPRSLLVMSGESRFLWSHGITPRKSDIVPGEQGGLTLVHRGVRTSFTFRKLSPTAGISPKEEKDSVCHMPVSEEEATALESQHVYKVYEEIAEHFSDTRHKPWPRIAEFLLAQEPGSILVDVGCGNGKYFGINKQLVEVGSDRSENLAGICQARGYQVFVADILSIPVRSDSVDVGLCIAVIHHLSTHSRRRKAVEELVRILRPGGSVLIYVWAQEQELNKQKSKYLKPGKQNQQKNRGDGDDLACKLSEQATLETGLQEGELHDSSSKLNAERSVGGMQNISPKMGAEDSRSECVTQIHDSKNIDHAHSPDTNASENMLEQCEWDTNSKGKPLLVHVNRTEFKEQDMLVPWKLKKGQKQETEKDSGDGKEFHRYYHVFRQGELEALCSEVPNCVLKSSYYDQGNWCVVLCKTR